MIRILMFAAVAAIMLATLPRPKLAPVDLLRIKRNKRRGFAVVGLAAAALFLL